MRDESNASALPLKVKPPIMPKKTPPGLKTDKFDGFGNLVETVWHFTDDDMPGLKAQQAAYVNEWRDELLEQHATDLEVASIGILEVLTFSSEAKAARDAINEDADDIVTAINATSTVAQLAAVDWAKKLAAHDITTEKLEVPS